VAHDGVIRCGGLSRRKKRLVKCLNNDAYTLSECAQALFACLDDESLGAEEFTHAWFVTNKGMFPRELYEALLSERGFEGLAFDLCSALAFCSNNASPDHSKYENAASIAVASWGDRLRMDLEVRCDRLSPSRIQQILERFDTALDLALPQLFQALSRGKQPRAPLKSALLDLDAPLLGSRV